MAHKKAGETMGECTARIICERKKQGMSTHLTYAGRLDPLASGTVIFLENAQEIADKDLYTSCSKAYEFEVLFGVSTDTHDPLGVITDVSSPTLSNTILNDNAIGNIIKRIRSVREIQYPLFSSKTVQGIPLWVYGKKIRKGIIKKIPYEFPKKEVCIYDLQFISQRSASTEILISEVRKKIDSVSGDFDQQLCIDSWNAMGFKYEGISMKTEWQLITFRAKVSSGTYIRTLAQMMGELSCGAALAYSIHRTHIHVEEIGKTNL